jgi:hypothetical protein
MQSCEEGSGASLTLILTYWVFSPYYWTGLKSGDAPSSRTSWRCDFASPLLQVNVAVWVPAYFRLSCVVDYCGISHHGPDTGLKPWRPRVLKTHIEDLVGPEGIRGGSGSRPSQPPEGLAVLAVLAV